VPPVTKGGPEAKRHERLLPNCLPRSGRHEPCADPCSLVRREPRSGNEWLVQPFRGDFATGHCLFKWVIFEIHAQRSRFTAHLNFRCASVAQCKDIPVFGKLAAEGRTRGMTEFIGEPEALRLEDYWRAKAKLYRCVLRVDAMSAGVLSTDRPRGIVGLGFTHHR